MVIKLEEVKGCINKARWLARENSEGNIAMRLGSGARLDPGERETARIHFSRFSGEDTWELYSAQLQVVTQHYSWMVAVTVTQLCLVLEGKALWVLVDLPQEQHDNLAVLTTSLQ